MDNSRKCPVCKETYWETYPHCLCDTLADVKEAKTMSKERRADWIINPEVVNKVREDDSRLDKINRFCYESLQAVFVDYFPISLAVIVLSIFLTGVFMILKSAL